MNESILYIIFGPYHQDELKFRVWILKNLNRTLYHGCTPNLHSFKLCNVVRLRWAPWTESSTLCLHYICLHRSSFCWRPTGRWLCWVHQRSLWSSQFFLWSWVSKSNLSRSKHTTCLFMFLALTLINVCLHCSCVQLERF